MILRSRYVYAVKYYSPARKKWKQREFDDLKKAQVFTNALREKRVTSWTLERAWMPTTLSRVLSAQLVVDSGRKLSVPLLPLVILLGLALAFWCHTTPLNWSRR